MGIGGKKGGGGDMVLESRHLVGLFLLIVVVSGVVFTLGYVLGRSQYDSQVRAATTPNKEAARPAEPSRPSVTAQPPGPAPSDWDFYRSAEPKKPEELRKSGKSVAAVKKPPEATPSSPKLASANTKSLLNAALVPHGAILLQVAALANERDALALAEALQKKKFPAFVLTPAADHYYRVQVGPYADAESANIAKQGLEHEGFKAIVRR